MSNETTCPQELNAEMEYSYHLAKKLLPFLARRKIPVTPKNYRLFYDYLGYSNTALNKLLNEMLESNAVFDSRLTDQLYEYFYGCEALESQALTLNRATMDMEVISSNMARSLATARDQADHYQKLLGEKSRQMVSLASDSRWQGFFDDVIEETDSSLRRQADLFQQIEDSNQVIASLKAELRDQANLARVDELTQLYNRRHLNLELPKYLEEAQRTGRPISLILFDLDHFKRVNDIWGHPLGDKVLALCAQTLKKASRQHDMAVRFGGEEFLLCCPGLPTEVAVAVAERIRVAISTTNITARGDTLPITISAGVSQYRPGETVEDLFSRIDQALYQAKREGRNRVVQV